MKHLLPALAALLLLGAAWGQRVPGAQTVEQWYEKLRDTGLPREVVAVLPVEIPGTGVGAAQRVLFVFVYIDERALETRTRWRDVLIDYVGKNAVLVWAYSQIPLVPMVRFDPQAIWFSQGEWTFRPEADDFANVDGDFLAGEVYFGKPVAAIVLLGEGFTPTESLTVHYGDVAEAVIPLVGEPRAP